MTIPFGPPSLPWTFEPETKTYDLSNASTKKLKIPTSAGVEGTIIILDPGKTALVIVDMQNYFLDARCMEHPNGLGAIEPTIRVLEACRRGGVQVIWLNWGLTDHDLETMPAGIQRGFMKDTLLQTTSSIRPWIGLGSELPDGQGRVLFEGSWNADIHPKLKAHVKENDIHCAKNRMSGLWNPEQPLWKMLKDGVRKNKEEAPGVQAGALSGPWETVVFAGVNTDQCVLGTLVDAYNAGWNCVMIDDCCGTTTKGAREVCVGNIRDHYGFVIDSTSFANAVSGMSV